MDLCKWCHAAEPAIPSSMLHPKMQYGSWCTRCAAEYIDWPLQKRTYPAGVIPYCTAEETGTSMLLFGRGRGHWCHPCGKNEDYDADAIMVACRQGAETTGHALGTPKQLRELFEAGKVFQPGRWGAYALDLGVLSAQERQTILDKHKKHLSEGLGQAVRPCEAEMSELRWFEAAQILDAIDGHTKDGAITMGQVSFRRWCTAFYKLMSKDQRFRQLCLKHPVALSPLSADDAELVEG
mmetsp:Transcript_89184/g.158048  ORF Transcript_89184/g.158048 Transcript_89184/m.158048 type:complete len:238 (+) Transcript_89184:45-758(+)|eukprot:CAMPEP_0197653030 /NCGR_PEP_ID=MMETSP1338-20131121/34807_1 /TAXON_ID=43686 ORGANISM="Pelagodinium beii, Strain RCC1491" /NCGR_SAMPLE_ID=MMETSP1338 /ASSEMBLY_ACC=CAM_ASM_000754 /LENGTH=237 /DNA_ID=CAMNT_0043228023 /DNA_START=43 /DNA_END=756 /DNA_ORIENTATION=+